MIDIHDFLRIAVITGVHGLDGRVKIYLITDVKERFRKGNMIFIRHENGFKEYRVLEFKEQKGRICLLRLDGIHNRSQAETLKGLEILIQKSTAEETRGYLEENEFYFFDIIGCKVYINDDEFGIVEDIMEAGSGEILIISGEEGKKHMVPFVKAMVNTARVRERRIDINPIEGLLDF